MKIWINTCDQDIESLREVVFVWYWFISLKDYAWSCTYEMS